jgi:hypothetical protein
MPAGRGVIKKDSIIPEKKSTDQLINEFVTNLMNEPGVESDPFIDPSLIGNVAKLASLPLIVAGKKIAQPVAKRIERDAVLAMGKRGKGRGTQELLESIISSDPHIAQQHTLRPFYLSGQFMAKLQNLGLRPQIKDPISQLNNITTYLENNPGLNLSKEKIAAMINFLEMHDPTLTNYLAPQNKMVELTKWARKTMDDYIKQGER